MRARARLSCCIVVAAAVFMAVTASCSVEDGDETSRLPALTLALLDGGGGAEIDLGATSAAPRVINLWATWCAPCRAELPAFDEVAAGAGDRVDFLGVNVAEDPQTAAALIEELGLRFAQAVDPDGDLGAELEVVGLPSTVFATATGEIVEIHTGPLTEDELTERIDALFGIDAS